jgi:murein DD-endopeptidase MepM/ murein hydrolase activator NlpD
MSIECYSGITLCIPEIFVYSGLIIEPISIYHKQLLRTFTNRLKTVLSPLTTALRSEKIQAYGLLFLVTALISFKGATGDQGFFSSLVHSYIEETAASVNDTIELQLADISDFVAMSGQSDSDAINPSMIQDNSIQAYEPASTDYILSFKPNKTIEYTVQPGDAISFIASDFGISVNTILWANNLKDANAISPGQVIKIPPVTGVVHIVRSGDTIASVAKKYNADTSKIMALNDLNETDSLQIGNELVVPDGEITNGSVTTINPKNTSSGITSLAKKFAYLPDLGDYFFIPVTGYNWGVVHNRNGVDVANSCGTPIRAAATGSADIADTTGYNGGFGKYIKLVHPNGTETLYGHLSKLLVVAGDYVQKGQIIGLMGTTGRSTGCHLHFEVHGARNPLAKY